MDGSFILETSIDKTICDQMVEVFETNLSKTEYDASREYHRLYSTDLPLELGDQVICSLMRCLQQYYDKWPWCERESVPIQPTHFNVQKYDVNTAYKGWHAEEYGPKPNEDQRKLVWMTYLNDVYNGGQTEFLYQSKSFVPRKGLTLIWPAGWTHPHKGNPATSQQKYIATGWFTYVTGL